VRRRAFITLLGGAAAAWPLAARAQQQAERVRRIGMLETVSPVAQRRAARRLRKGLREPGYVEGQTYAMEYRSADGYANRFPELAAELVRLGVDLIVVKGTPAAIAAELIKELAPTISRICLPI
jgi:putative ABC transport system substrate-binding protein